MILALGMLAAHGTKNILAKRFKELGLYRDVARLSREQTKRVLFGDPGT